MYMLDTAINIEPPKIALRSGLAYHYQIHILARVIDVGYRGSIKVLIHNLGDKDVIIDHIDCITQMICEKAVIPTVMDTTTLTATSRDTDAFGSTKQRIHKSPSPLHKMTNKTSSCNNDNDDHMIPFDTDEYIKPNPNSNAITISDTDIAIIRNMNTDIEPPFNITMGTDPFDEFLEIDISTDGTHPTLGLVLHTNNEIGERIQVTNYPHPTPAAKIPHWRSTLCYSFPMSIGSNPVNNNQDIKNVVKSARNNK